MCCNAADTTSHRLQTEDTGRHEIPIECRSSVPCRRQEPGKEPGPSAELDFWSRQAAALGSLQEQLRSEQLQRALQTLKAAHSTFLPGFTRCGCKLRV